MSGIFHISRKFIYVEICFLVSSQCLTLLNMQNWTVENKEKPWSSRKFRPAKTSWITVPANILYKSSCRHVGYYRNPWTRDAFRRDLSLWAKDKIYVHFLISQGHVSLSVTLSWPLCNQSVGLKKCARQLSDLVILKLYPVSKLQEIWHWTSIWKLFDLSSDFVLHGNLKPSILCPNFKIGLSQSRNYPFEVHIDGPDTG